MSEWSTASLGSVVKFISGGTPSKDEKRFWEGDIPWVSSAEMTQRWISNTRLRVTEAGAIEGSKRVPKNTVLVVVRGMSLAKEFRVSISQRDVTFNQDVKAALPSKAIDPVFLFFYLLSQSNAIRDSASEAAHGTKKLDMPVLEQWPIPVPPLPIQKKIAAILSAYDDLIANNQLRIALLERMAEDIYREWFVRLRFPGNKLVSIKKGIPQGWQQLSFGQFCVLKRGYDLPDATIEPGPYPVIASTSIKAHHKFFKVSPPVITTGRSGSLGEVLYVNAKAWPLNTALYVNDFCDNSPFLIFYTLKNMGLETFNAGAGVPSLNRNHLNGISIAVPPPAIQTAFDEQLSPIFKLKEGLEKQTELLKATREALLPRLISGKLAVDALDIRFPPEMQKAV